MTIVRSFASKFLYVIDNTYMKFVAFLRADYLHAFLFASFALVQFFFMINGKDIRTGLDVITQSTSVQFIISVFLIYFSLFLMVIKSDFMLVIAQLIVYVYVLSLLIGILQGTLSVVGTTAVIYLLFGSLGIANSVYQARENAKLYQKLQDNLANIYALKEYYYDNRPNTKKSA